MKSFSYVLQDAEGAHWKDGNHVDIEEFMKANL